VPQQDIDVTLGASWPEGGPAQCSYKTAAGDPAIPAGYVVRVQVRKHPNDTTLILEKTPDVDYVHGTWSLSFTPAETATFPTLCWWGMDLESPDGSVQVPLVTKGKVTTTQKVVVRP